MKRYIFYLISFGVMAWLAACTPPSVEPAYEPSAMPITREIAELPTALISVTHDPIELTSTATAVPTDTPTPTETATAVPPTIAASETPTAVPATETAVPPTIQITATQPVTTTLTTAQTPAPGWQFYTSDVHGISLQIPDYWLPTPDFPYGFQGDDGFINLLATNSQDNLLENACQDVVWGTAVPIEWRTVAGQKACLIQMEDGGQATLIVRFPQLREAIVPGVAYAFLVLQADPAHMPGIIESMTFFTPPDLSSPTS